jgi:hypothetical protein
MTSNSEFEPFLENFPLPQPSGGMIRRREESKADEFPESYTYASSPLTAPEMEKQPLKSQTFGGLGPVYGDDIGDGSKFKAKNIHTKLMLCLRNCGCSNHAMISNEGPNGDFYRDDFNDQPHGCSIGTSEEDGIWMNRSDGAGCVMAGMVWFLFIYSAITVTFLAETGGIRGSFSMLYVTLTSLALASHAKTQLTDPGTVTSSAQPIEAHRKMDPNAPFTMCSQCQSYKPPFSHHCRICNRCISRMDHHCPWMNNCIGAANLKHFILFLVYTWLTNAMALMLLGYNYFFCVTEDCTFTTLLVQLARIMTIVSTGSLLFTSSMIMNVIYGVMTGIGTIDRLKKKAMDTMLLSEEEPIALKDIFGIAGYHTWFIPIDPIFEDYDRVVGFSTPQRLLREEMKDKGYSNSNSGASVATTNSYPV